MLSRCLSISLRLGALPVLCAAAGTCAHAQTLTVSASPSSVGFTLARNGTASGNSSLTITTSWTLLVSPLTLTLYAYASSTNAALTDGSGHNIPSAKLSGSPDGGAYAAFVGTSPFATGDGITVFTQTSTLGANGSRNDTLALRIDTTGLNLPAATYSGTLTLRAQIM